MTCGAQGACEYLMVSKLSIGLIACWIISSQNVWVKGSGSETILFCKSRVEAVFIKDSSLETVFEGNKKKMNATILF